MKNFKIKNKIKDIMTLSISLPFVILIYGSILAMISIPIVLLIWLIKQIF